MFFGGNHHYVLRRQPSLPSPPTTAGRSSTAVRSCGCGICTRSVRSRGSVSVAPRAPIGVLRRASSWGRRVGRSGRGRRGPARGGQAPARSVQPASAGSPHLCHPPQREAERQLQRQRGIERNVRESRRSVGTTLRGGQPPRLGIEPDQSAAIRAGALRGYRRTSRFRDGSETRVCGCAVSNVLAAEGVPMERMQQSPSRLHRG